MKANLCLPRLRDDGVAEECYTGLKTWEDVTPSIGGRRPRDLPEERVSSLGYVWTYILTIFLGENPQSSSDIYVQSSPLISTNQLYHILLSVLYMLRVPISFNNHAGKGIVYGCYNWYTTHWPALRYHEVQNNRINNIPTYQDSHYNNWTRWRPCSHNEKAPSLRYE